MSYLEEAADLLRKAADLNEKTMTAVGTRRNPGEINEGRERIAMKFAQLGAIERGLVPAEMVGDLLTWMIRTDKEN